MNAYLRFLKAKQSLILSCFQILLLFVISTGCQKSIDVPGKGEELPGTPLPGQGTYCRIESIWEKDHGGRGEQRYILILYNEFENPVAVTVPQIGTSKPYRTFRYDTWHRLKDYLGTYGNEHFLFWHKYGYDNSGRIGYDTLYIMGGIRNGEIDWYSERRTSEIEYDSQNRITKVATHSDFSGTSVTTYSYDAAGNLIRPGVTYDNKTNLHRTNDIWMFLARNYSMNNPVIADQFNSAGYPIVINSSGNFFNFADMEINLHKSEIGYSCRPSNYY